MFECQLSPMAKGFTRYRRDLKDAVAVIALLIRDTN